MQCLLLYAAVPGNGSPRSRKTQDFCFGSNLFGYNPVVADIVTVHRGSVITPLSRRGWLLNIGLGVLLGIPRMLFSEGLEILKRYR